MRPTIAILIAAGALAHAGCAGPADTPADATLAGDDADEVLLAASACDRGAPAASGRAAQVRLLRAWLDGAELPAVVPTEPRPTVDDALITRGRTLYDRACAGCHADNGDGSGLRARTLTEPIPDLGKGLFALRSTETGALPGDDDLFATVSRGVHGTGMAPWLLVPERDRWAVVAYVKTLSPAFADDEAPPPIAIGEPPVATPELIARGDALFHSAGCSSCHGDHARGDGPAAAALHMATGAPAHPRDLTGVHFHRGSDVRAIFQTITTGLDGSPMASFAKVMSEDDRWAVATYVHGLVPSFVDGPGGLRCPIKAQRAGDELIGVRAELRGLARLQP